MGVYIMGMEMPEHCDECYIREKDTCPLTKTNVTGWGIPLNCPLVPVPPHGRLIDADALITTFCKWGTALERGQKLVITMSEAKQAIVDIIDNAPTIIPASEESEI